MRRAAGKKQRQEAARTLYSAFANGGAPRPSARGPESDESWLSPSLFRKPKLGEAHVGVRMGDANIDRYVDYINDLFLMAHHGYSPPRSVDLLETPDGGLWLMFGLKDGRTAVLELRLRNRLRASITVASLATVDEQLSYTRTCAEFEMREYEKTLREGVSRDHLLFVERELKEARDIIDEICGELREAEVVLPRHDVESAVAFVIAAEEAPA